ncbi:MAG: hypothetical protein EA352_02350 [Gemmatimonadales bacterium]|nr:MAG: hypothetical protein EA352_02350 [Gemmatimonadales bacterium]
MSQDTPQEKRRFPRHNFHQDMDLRPRTYGDFEDPVALALNGISGQRRREMIRDMLTAQGEERKRLEEALGPIHPDLLEEQASESFQSTMTGTAGPTWMGGEYLPPLLPGEVEIARIVLQSATMDVSVVRARWHEGRYHYRMVDEYDTHFQVSPKVSDEPLTLGELIDLLEGAGAVVPWWEAQTRAGRTREEAIDFASVESELYPGLGPWYEARALEWVEEGG